MFHRSDDRSLQWDITADLQDSGTDKGFANGRRVLGAIGAGDRHQRQTNYRYETSTHTQFFSLSTRCQRVTPSTMTVVTVETKRPVLLIGAFAVLFVAFVALLIRLLPGQRTPFDYMVAGTFATALALIVVFVLIVRRR